MDGIFIMQTKKYNKVHFIGKINRDIYQCVDVDLVTDEVIITNKQIQHIMDRRGKEFYDC